MIGEGLKPTIILLTLVNRIVNLVLIRGLSQKKFHLIVTSAGPGGFKYFRFNLLLRKLTDVPPAADTIKHIIQNHHFFFFPR
jgi:hypothetical protein